MLNWHFYNLEMLTEMFKFVHRKRSIIADIMNYCFLLLAVLSMQTEKFKLTLKP